MVKKTKTETVNVKEAPVKETASKVVEAAEKKIEKAAEAVKKTAKAPVKRAVANKTKAAVKETVYLQYFGREIDKDEVIKNIKNVWTKTLKNKVADLKTITVYLKPEENAAYYVINDEVTGKVEL